MQGVLSGLPPVVTSPDFTSDQPPECDNSDRPDAGATPSDFFGRVNFNSVFAWWQPPAVGSSDATSEK
jgi:hypothetical protein